MTITEERKASYVSRVHKELRLRGLSQDDIPRVVAKTGFTRAMEEYPEEQLHYDPADAADEILVVAARE